VLTCSPAQQAPNSPRKLSAPPTRSGASPGLARSRILGQLPPPAQPRRALLAQPRGAAGIWGFSPDAPPIWDSVPDAPAGPDTAAIWQSLPDAPPDGWIAWRVHTHTTNSRRGPPATGSWHGLALSGISRAPPLPARLPTGHPPPVSGRAAQGQPDRPGRVTWPSRGSAATQGVGAEGAARFPADEAGRWGRAPIVRRRPPRWDSCRRRRRLPQALASRHLTWCAPREHFGR
jgi:hypothetical protein